MSAVMAKISERSLRHSGLRKATKEAWSAYVRRRWPENCQAHCEREFDLTPGRANGLVWSNITQPTIDHILAHPRGGRIVLLEVAALQFGQSLHELIADAVTTLRERAADERARAEETEGRLVALSDRLVTAGSRVASAGARRAAGEPRGWSGDGRRTARGPDRPTDGLAGGDLSLWTEEDG